MAKRTSQERLKVVILRDLGLSWEKIREKMRFSNKSTAQTIYNKTGTSQVGAISKSQKAQNIFLEKT